MGRREARSLPRAMRPLRAAALVALCSVVCGKHEPHAHSSASAATVAVHHAVQGTPVSLLEQFASANVDYFGSARVYRYPDAPGQTKEELVQCFREQRVRCGSKFNQPCDPDDDASGLAHSGVIYLPQDIGELFLLTTGNVGDLHDRSIDLYVLNPFLMLSSAVEECNGMNHSQRLEYWVKQIRHSKPAGHGKRIEQNHVFVSVAWSTSRQLKGHWGDQLRRLASSMTFLINEKNHLWAGWAPHATGRLMVVPYLSHRYLAQDVVQQQILPVTRLNLITFIGTLRANFYRLVGDKLRGKSFARIGVSRRFEVDEGSKHRDAALGYSLALQESTFCLSIAGDTLTSRRLFDAISAGCIPVIITGPGWTTANKDRHVEQTNARAVKWRRELTMATLPFREIVPYDAFCIFVDGAEWYNRTVEVAQAIVDTPQDTVQVRTERVCASDFADAIGRMVTLGLQRNLARWRSVFDYRDPQADLQRLVVTLLVNSTKKNSTKEKHTR